MNAPAAKPWVIETTAANFDEDVFKASRERLTVVDFWAPWCAPCRALGPVLEKLAADFQGAFMLVKANADEVPEAAARFNVSGIPAVYAVCDEQIVDFFSGALPEQHVRSWLERVLAAARAVQARSLEKTAPAEAESIYREMLSAVPSDPTAKLSLARVLLSRGQLDECQQLLRELDDHGYLEGEGQKLKAALELNRQQSGDLPALRAAAEANPNDFARQFQLAEGLAGAKQYEESLRILLSLVHRDKKGVGVQSKELMVRLFQALPDDSELVSEYRRKLSIALY